MKIVKITHGPVDLRRILPASWQETCDEFMAEGIDLTKVKWKNEKDLRILVKDLKVRVYTAKDGVLEYIFKRGWLTDLASVPSYFRTLVDNDGRNIVIAALVHDANFGGHWLTFNKSNTLFRQMISFAGGSWWFCFKAYWGVQNPIGVSAYERPDEEIRKEQIYARLHWLAK
jgi:hypothetical protein